MWAPDTSAVFSEVVLQKAHLSACVITGALMCFFGRRAFKVVLGLFGALVGVYAAAAVGFHLSDGKQAVTWFCGLTGGVLGGVLMVTLYLLGVFVLGAALGGILAAVFTLQAGPDARVIVISVVAAIGGLLALFIQRFIVIVATALNGAALVIGGMWLLYARLSLTDAYTLYVSSAADEAPAPAIAWPVYKYLLVGAWATLGCLGAWAQFSAGEGTQGNAEPDEGDARRGRRRPWSKPHPR